MSDGALLSNNQFEVMGATTEIPATACRVAIDIQAEKIRNEVLAAPRNLWIQRADGPLDGNTLMKPVCSRILPLIRHTITHQRLGRIARTKVLSSSPYLDSFLRGLPGIPQCAHVLAAPSGLWREPPHSGKTINHGFVRLFVPIISSKDAQMLTASVSIPFASGGVWANLQGGRTEIFDPFPHDCTYLVIDLIIDSSFKATLPPSVQLNLHRAAIASRPKSDVRFDADSAPEFIVPRALFDFETCGMSEDMTDTINARILNRPKDVVIKPEGLPSYPLDHVGGNQLRFAHWSDQRTIIPPKVLGENGRLIIRCGDALRTVPLLPYRT